MKICRTIILLVFLIGSLSFGMAQRQLMTNAGTYSGATKYAQSDVVFSVDSYYISLIANNLNNTPASSPSDWRTIGSTGTCSGDLGGAYPNCTVLTLDNATSANLSTGLSAPGLYARGMDNPLSAPVGVASAGGTVGVSVNNYAMYSGSFNSGSFYTAPSPISSAVATTSPDQTITWNFFPISNADTYYVWLCQGTCSSAADFTYYGSAAGSFVQSAAVNTYTAGTPTILNDSGLYVSGPALLNSLSVQQLNVFGLVDIGPPTSSGATSGGTVGVSAENYATCQAVAFNFSTLTILYSAVSALSAPVVTDSGDQTIPWVCPVEPVTPSLPWFVVYLVGLCQGSSCTPAYYASGGTPTNVLIQSTAASTYSPYSSFPGGYLTTNNTGSLLQGYVQMPNLPGVGTPGAVLADSTGHLSIGEDSYVLPIATPSSLGGVIPDNTTCTVNGSTGVLTCPGSPVQTCDASTIAAYQPAVCTVTLTTAQLLSFDGTGDTAIQVIAGPNTGFAVNLGLNPTVEYLFNTTPFAVYNIATFNFVYDDDDSTVLWTNNFLVTNSPGVPDFTQSVNDFAPLVLLGINSQTSSNANGQPVDVYLGTVLTLGDGSAVLTIPFTVVPIT